MKPERLTRHFDESKQESLELYDLRDIGLELRKNEKLSKLEDIEEELGIDLATLFKALNDGVYFEKDKKHHIVALDLGSSGNYRLSYEVIDGFFESVYTKDYGKTWALTKEELE